VIIPPPPFSCFLVSRFRDLFFFQRLVEASTSPGVSLGSLLLGTVGSYPTRHIHISFPFGLLASGFFPHSLLLWFSLRAVCLHLVFLFFSLRFCAGPCFFSEPVLVWVDFALGVVSPFSPPLGKGCFFGETSTF